MGKFIINGGRELFGEVTISPAKNSCLPLIASTILFKGQFLLQLAPEINDIIVMSEIVKNLGGSYSFLNDGLFLNTENINSFTPSEDICKRARASFFVAGALLSRFKRAVVALPGGCKIGQRPVDIHISVLNQLGAKCYFDENRVVFDGKNMKAGITRLSYPSVGATINAVCATVFLKGESTIINCAKEPEIVDLCKFLNACGCNIAGAGSDRIVVNGVDLQKGVNLQFLPIKDRIEAGTYICACAACGGKISFEYDSFDNILAVIKLLNKSGATITMKKGIVNVECDKRNINCKSVVADVFPAFPTDLQSIYCALCTFSNGTTRVEDRVFQNRFEFLKELKKQGVDCEYIKNSAIIRGNKKLHGATVNAVDLRGGAGLIISGLAIDGETIVENSEIIKRGYYKIEEKFTSLGAFIKLVD